MAQIGAVWPGDEALDSAELPNPWPAPLPRSATPPTATLPCTAERLCTRWLQLAQRRRCPCSPRPALLQHHPGSQAADAGMPLCASVSVLCLSAATLHQCKQVPWIAPMSHDIVTSLP